MPGLTKMDMKNRAELRKAIMEMALAEESMGTVAEAITALAAQLKNDTKTSATALNAVVAAMSELVEVVESKADKSTFQLDTDGLIRAIAALKVVNNVQANVPDVVNHFAPAVNVPTQPVALTVQSGPTHIHNTGADALDIAFTYENGRLSKARIVRTQNSMGG